MQSGVFPTVTDERPFQDYLLSKILLTQISCLLEDMNNGCAVQSATVSLMKGLFKTTFQVKLS